MDTELKPCPFCGEEAGICEANDICFHRDDDGSKIFGGWRCFCPSCAIEQIGYETREEAVSAWNNRSTEHATHRAPVDEKGGGRMTGIDRLRTLAGAWDEWGLGGTLAEMADEIDRELREERDRWESDLHEAEVAWNAVAGVCLDMERHVSGVEGADDSPVARWARELREALGGDVRDHADDVSMSAYDLLSQEEREIIAWVRDHGGLDSVKKLLDWVVGHCSTKQQLDFDFWLSGRVMHELGFEEDMADRDEVERRLLARLMPEGMEWPRYESGELMQPNDKLLDNDGDWFKAVVFEFTCDWWSVRGYQTEGFGDLNDETRRKLEGMAYGTCVKRPEPKVLDADGVETRVKETVFDKITGEELIVTGFEDGRVWCEHRMTDADALPVRGMWSPDQLTHERPESWERLERDANASTCTYFGATTKDCEICGHVSWECSYDKASDLVRRCRALAERERGE